MFCTFCCNRLQQVSFFCPLPPPTHTHTHTHNSPVAQAGHRTSVVLAGLGTGTSAGAAESQPPVSSSSPPVPPSPSPPPADGCTPLVSVIRSARGGRRWEEGGGWSMKGRSERIERRRGGEIGKERFRKKRRGEEEGKR